MRHVKRILMIAIVMAGLTSKAQDGAFRRYYDNGRLHESGFIRDGVCDSTWTMYSADGRVTATAHYRLGCKVGTWEFVQPDKIVKLVYDRGVKVRYVEVALDGTPLVSKDF